MPQMTAAPVPITIGGRELRMAPLSDRDVDELTNCMRTSLVRTAKLALTPDMEPDERQEILSAAIARASVLSYGEPESHAWLGSLDGKLRLMYQGFRRFQPSLTFEEFRNLLRAQDGTDSGLRAYDRDAMDEMGRLWQELNIPQQKHPSAGEAGQRTAADEGRDLPPAGETLPLHPRRDRGHDAVAADEYGVA